MGGGGGEGGGMGVLRAWMSARPASYLGGMGIWGGGGGGGHGCVEGLGECSAS